MTTHDIAVIGGGIGGLVAATSAALEGARVIVLDGAKELGGRGRSESGDGFTINLGPHALYLGGGLDRALVRLSVKVRGRKVSGTGSRVLDGDRLRSMPGSPLSIALTSWLAPGERAALMRAFARLAIDAPAAHAAESVEDYLASIATGPARDLLRGLVRVSTYGGDLDAMSAECAISQLQGALLAGVMYLDGGWQTIVDGLARRARGLGVSVALGHRAHAIDGEGPFIIRTTAGEVRARSVIVVTPPKTAAELVDRGDGTLARFAELATPVHLACLDTKVDPSIGRSTALVLGLDGPFYVQDHARVAALAPKGGGLVHAARYADGKTHDSAEVRADLERITRLALGLDRADGRGLDSRFMPKLVVHHALVTRKMGGFAGRPPVKTARRGVFVAGDWVGGAGLLADATAASASIAARCAVEFVRVRGEDSLHAG